MFFLFISFCCWTSVISAINTHSFTTPFCPVLMVLVFTWPFFLCPFCPSCSWLYFSWPCGLSILSRTPGWWQRLGSESPSLVSPPLCTQSPSSFLPWSVSTPTPAQRSAPAAGTAPPTPPHTSVSDAPASPGKHLDSNKESNQGHWFLTRNQEDPYLFLFHFLIVTLNPVSNLGLQCVVFLWRNNNNISVLFTITLHSD